MVDLHQSSETATQLSMLRIYMCTGNVYIHHHVQLMCAICAASKDIDDLIISCIGPINTQYSSIHNHDLIYMFQCNRNLMQK